MSEFDAIRNRRKQGQDAKERVLSRVYSPSGSDESSSEFAAVRNRSITPINQLGGVGGGMYGPPSTPKMIENAKKMAEQRSKTNEQGGIKGVVYGPPASAKTLMKVRDAMVVAEANKSEYQKAQDEIDKLPGGVKQFATAMNWLTRGNPIGAGLSRMTNIPGVSAVPAPSTGNNTVDKITGWVGENVAPMLVPSGAPTGSGMIGAPAQAAEKLLATGKGEKAVNTLAKAIPGVKPKTAQGVAKGALIGAVDGAIGTPAQDLLLNSGASGKELLTDAAIGAAGGLFLGGLGGGAATKLEDISRNRAVAKAINKAVDNTELPTIPPNTRTKRTVGTSNKADDMKSLPTQARAEAELTATRPPIAEPEFPAGPLSQDDIPEFLVQRNRQRTPEPIETKIPESSAVEPAESMKQDWFTDLFGNQGVGIKAGSALKTENKGPLTTADQIVKSPLKNDIKGVVDSAKAKARAVYQDYVDRLDPLKRINDDTYEAAMDTARANNLANTIIRDKFVTPEGTVVGESLNNIFKKVARGQDKDFVDYITLRHAETRVSRGERVYDERLGMTPEKIRQRIEMYDKRFPEFKNIAAEWDKFNDNVLRYLGVDEGLISPELYKSMRDENPFYSPMRRQFSKSEKPGRNFIQKTTSSSFSGQKAPLKKVSPTGSVRDIVDPRRTITEAVGAWTNAAMRNRVMQSMVEAIKRDPEMFKGIAEIVKKPKDKTDLKKLLAEGGMDDFVEALDDDFKNLFKTTRVDQDNIVRAMVKGQPVYIQVHDPEIVKTLIGMGPQASNVLIDVLSAFSNATKRGATGVFAPVFAVKGATMDLVQSAIQAKNPAKQAAYTVYAILSGIGDRLKIPGLKNLAEEYRRAGGEFSAAIKGDRKLNKNISDMTRYPLLSPQGIAKGVKKTFAAPFKTLEAIGDIAENAPRMAAYKLEMQRLGGERTPENVRQAMSQAREITTNFSRRGAKTQEIEALVPYNNAAIQGTYRVLRGLKNNPIRTAAAISTLAVLPKMLEYMQFSDDPDYQNLPARERYRFLIVNKNADGTFTKIPMEAAYNSFGEIAIEALRRFKDNDPKAFKGAVDAIANAWLPPVVTGALQGVTQDGGAEKSIVGAINSTVAAPFVAVASNQSFTGAPIVSQALSDRSPKYQYDEKTSIIAKKLGEYLDMSPMKVDYIIRSYGGDPARLILPLTSDVGQGNTRNTLLKNFIVDPQYTTTLTEDFYDAKEKLNQAYHDYTEAGAPLPEWYNDDLRKALNSTAKGSVSKQLSYYRDLKKQINADKTLSAKDKTDKLRQAQEEINKIYIDVNSVLEQAGIINK